MKAVIFNMKTLTFSILMMCTVYCISQPRGCDGQIYSGWGNPMKSRYLLGKFFPVLPEFYPATLNEEVSLIFHEFNFKIFVPFYLHKTNKLKLIISELSNQDASYLSQIPSKRGISLDPYQLYRGNKERNNHEKSVMICKILGLMQLKFCHENTYR